MQKGLKKPKMLQRGDTLAAVTLSWGGPSVFPHRYQAGKKQLEEAFGVRVVEMPHTLSSAEFLHKNPQARAADLMQAFLDSAINGIISTIGGDDSIRLLPYMDLDIITRHPKVFLGFSDTTVSHLMCFNAGVGSFYGPAIMAGFGENGGLLPYMRDSIAHVLFSADSIGEIPQNTDGWTVEMLDWADPAHQSQKRKLTASAGWHFLQGEGQHSGHLMGGCIEVLDWLRGSPLWPGSAIWKGAVLFLETSEEAPAPQAVARILRAFAAAGVLKKISAVLFGRPGGQVPLDQFTEYERVLLEIIAGEAGQPDLPIVTGMDFGHTDPAMVLPYGCTCVVDCDRHTLTIPESAVST